MRRWHREQFWLRWDARTNSYSFSTRGASQYILSGLDEQLTLHRGASALEASFWRGVKQYYTGKLGARAGKELTATLASIAEEWALKPTAKSRLQRLIKTGLPTVSTRASRRNTSLFLLDLISQRVESNVGYGAISATPSLATASAWASGTESGQIWNRKQQPSAVISFQFNRKRAPAKILAGIYAGVEDGAFLQRPSSVEVAFVSPEAKLFALEHLKIEAPRPRRW